MKKKRIVSVLVLLAVLCTAAISAQAAGFFNFFSPQSQNVTISSEEYDRLSRYKKLDNIMQYIEDYFVDEPDTDLMLEYAIRGMMSALDDPYTFYYNADEWKKMNEDDQGDYVGVGIQMLSDMVNNTVTITRTFRDMAAQLAGIRKGDQLVRVDDIEVDVYNLQEAINIMRGEVGGSVEVEVLRGDEYLTFNLIRSDVHVNRVEYTMLDDQVGYIILYEFAGDSEKEFAEALTELENEGAKSLILDLRDNGGGWVQSAIDIADLFLDDGILAYAEDRYGSREEYHMKKGSTDMPLLILVNGNSASSSEILSGGLHDRGRATLLGTKTFGKGIIQSVVGIKGDKLSYSHAGATEGFQMTYAQYYLPSGAKVHKEGITPDIELEMPEEMSSILFELGDMNDPQLKEGWEIARKMSAQ